MSFAPPGSGGLCVCHRQVLPGFGEVSIMLFEGDRGGCSGAGCVCLLVVQVLGVGVLRVPRYLLWRKLLHQFHSSVLQKCQPRGRPVQCLQW